MMRTQLKIMMISVIFNLMFVSPSTLAGTIRMGYFLLPPHVYRVEGETKPRGASISYFEAVSAQMGETVEWVGPLPLSRLGTYLKEGQESLDGTLICPKTPIQEAYLYYPDTPYYAMQYVFAVRRDNPLTEIRTIDDIAGYRIGYIKTVPMIYPPLLDQHLDRVQLEELGGDEWIRQNLQKLIAGRLDAVLDKNQDTIPFEAMRLKLDHEIKILLFPAPSLQIYMTFTKSSPRGQALVTKYNSAVKSLNLNYADFIQQEVAAGQKR